MVREGVAGRIAPLRFEEASKWRKRSEWFLFKGSGRGERDEEVGIPVGTEGFQRC